MGVHRAVLPSTDHVLWRRVGLGNVKDRKRLVPSRLARGKSRFRHYSSCQMDLVIVVACYAAACVALNLFAKEDAGLLQSGQMLLSAGACNPVPWPGGPGAGCIQP